MATALNFYFDGKIGGGRNARNRGRHARRNGNVLTVEVKPDQISWSYGLNTANYPTYGGEVVQILSCYFDDLTVIGQVGTYEDIEIIYGWFIDYMQAATQGEAGKGSFDTSPVIMTYKPRGWKFRLYPKSLPGFKYGRDVVAPTWKLVAAIAEPGQAFKNAVYDRLPEIYRETGLTFGRATMAQFADPFDDPFSGPTDEAYKKDKLRGAYGELADTFNNLIPSYLEGDFEDLSASYSKPTFLAGGVRDGKNTGTNRAKNQAEDQRR